MRQIGMMIALGLLLIACAPIPVMAAWGTSADSVLLKDIEVLTLYSGKMTKGGRSSPVPQLECVKGGTAPCDAFRPRVVQCYNRGWDGVDVQWECKTDMDNAYRFGDIEVTCEGYSHRDDPFVLKGSCGLRYSIDYTKEGLNQQQGHQHNYYGEKSTGYGYHSYEKSRQPQELSHGSSLANFIVVIAVLVMCWAFYKTCIDSSHHVGQDARSTTNDDYPTGGGGGGYGWFGQGGGTYPSAPPPPPYEDDASCRNRRNASAPNTGSGGGGGGFWTGAAAGGLLGYMFGNRGTGYGGYGQANRGSWFSGSGMGSSWQGGGGGFHSSHRGGNGSSSTGTRTASGFGGTSRR